MSQVIRWYRARVTGAPTLALALAFTAAGCAALAPSVPTLPAVDLGDVRAPSGFLGIALDASGAFDADFLCLLEKQLEGQALDATCGVMSAARLRDPVHAARVRDCLHGQHTCEPVRACLDLIPRPGTAQAMGMCVLDLPLPPSRSAQVADEFSAAVVASVAGLVGCQEITCASAHLAQLQAWVGAASHLRLLKADLRRMKKVFRRGLKHVGKSDWRIICGPDAPRRCSFVERVVGALQPVDLPLP